MKKRGRKKSWKKVSQVIDLRIKGLTFRQIAGALKSDVKTVYRWYGYGLSDEYKKIIALAKGG